MLKKWSTVEIANAVRNIQECGIIKTTQPEDYTTDTLHLAVRGSSYLWVRGFRTDRISPAKDDNKIEMVEVTTGYSDGDMPNDPILCVVHARVKAEIMKLGYSVVNSLDPYF
jgi:hypothetical protein